MNNVDLTSKTNGSGLSTLPTVTPHRTDIIGSWAVVVLTAFLFCAIIVAVALGSVVIPAGEVVDIILAKVAGSNPASVAPALVDIVWDIRVPRVLLAALVGAGLALSGTVMQATVQNPLAEPFILGIASGASVGAVVAILLGHLLGAVQLGVPVWAFGGAVIATLAVLVLAGLGTKISTVKLVLAGAVVGALCTALSNFIIYMAGDAEGMQSAAFWTMGSLADAKWSMLLWPILVVAGMGLYFLSQVRVLDALLLGEEMAITLGINAVRKRYVYMACVALLTGVLVSQCGIIGFVGLVIPHMCRNIVGVGHKRLLPVVILGGAIFLVLADLLSRVLLPSGDLPIGILTALLGAPLFMKLLFGNSKNFGG
ncbi:MAG: iron ABC transporter permease [Veillonella sp.]|uniref:FecCD family ABC transporter permease n=1 Tax=Veillonella sp. TaxID=1926307 RepID=UPI0025DE6717|nr:iron ABC transporter permease [Veillonella sp.]MBS4913350.1 iron ABC transporter permease [Veillonella sp.]